MVTKEFLIKKIQEKKELRGLSVQIVIDVVDSYLSHYRMNLEQVSKHESIIIVKEVRRKLHIYTARFQRNAEDRASLISARRYKDVLTTHASTAVRITDYVLLRNELKKRNVKSILDLGCGLNPIALAESGMKYYAVDIREDEQALLAAFFHQEGITGKGIICDIRKNLPSVPPVDACLLMNVLDVLETRGHKRAEEIITGVNARYFFITFSTKTLSKRPMRHPQRGWIERLLTRRGFLWERVSLSTEILYIANYEESEFAKCSRTRTHPDFSSRVLDIAQAPAAALVPPKRSFMPVVMRKADIIMINECLIPALMLPSASLPMTSPVKNPCVRSK